MTSYELRDKLFVKKWNESSQLDDRPHKLWVQLGFSWCWDICSEINKQLENDNESYLRIIKRLDDKLEQREKELAQYKLESAELEKGGAE